MVEDHKFCVIEQRVSNIEINDFLYGKTKFNRALSRFDLTRETGSRIPRAIMPLIPLSVLFTCS